MTLLRNVLTDLVDKKLWPVALGLVVALVAGPLVLARGGDDRPLPAVPAVAAEDEPVVVTPAEKTSTSDVDRRPNDPFRARPSLTTPTGPAAGSDTAGAAPAPGSASAFGSAPDATMPSGADSGASLDFPGFDDIDVVPVTGTDTDTVTDTDAPTAPSGSDDARPADDAGSWHVDLRFGTTAEPASHEDLARLSPLPSADKPYVMFLGVAADGRTGLFLVTSDAQATGDGTCVRGATACDLVQLRAGQVETFEVTTVDGKHETYHLELQTLARKNADDAAAARTARQRESEPGRTVLRQAVATKQVDVSGLAYSQALGLVVPSARTASVDRSLFGGFRVDLRFGAPGELVKRYNLARLTPLPSVEVPAFVFLGVLGDGETAIFLNPSEAHASGGEAVCEPTPEQCQRVKLRKGQSATFDAPTLDGGTTRYQLDIDGITPLEASTAEQAEASRTRESPAGRVILRRLVHEVGGLVADLTFSGAKGVLQKTPPTAE